MLATIFATIALFCAVIAVAALSDRATLLREICEAEDSESDAHDAREAAERDALALCAQNEQCRERLTRLSGHVHTLLRERSQLQPLQLPTPRRFHIEKTATQIQATRSANLN